MDADCYKVEILHFINPHLIWVEAKTNDSENEFAFEQIGIYGILPLESTIDIVEKKLKTQRTEEWMPAATAVMVQFLDGAKEVWFTPTFVDRRTTIFDDNIYKFGEIIALLPDGTQKKISKALIDKNLALFDGCVFHQELSNGILKTKLSAVQTQEVIKQFDRYYKQKNKKELFEKSVMKQTQIFQTAQQIQSTLTAANLEEHNLKQQNDTLMAQKLKVLNICKGVDEESVGRALKKKSPDKNNIHSGLLRKKLGIINDDTNLKQNNPIDIFNYTKQFIDKNAVKKISSASNNSEDKVKDFVVNAKFAMQIEISPEKTSIKTPACTINKTIENIQENSIGPMNLPKATPLPDINSKSAPVKPSNKVKGKNLIAFGPPGLNKLHLSQKYAQEIDNCSDTNTPLERNESFNETVSDTPVKYCNLDEDDNVDFHIKKNLIKTCYKLDKEIVSKNISNSFIKDVKNSPKDNIKLNNDSKNSFAVESCNINNTLKSKILQSKSKLHKEKELLDSSFTSGSETTNKDTNSSLEAKNTKEDDFDKQELEDLAKKLSVEYKPLAFKNQKTNDQPNFAGKNEKNNVNPFKNIDSNMSVFVDKLVTPVLMVHNKMNKRIEPRCEMRDIPFGSHIHSVLKILHVEHPMTLQTVSWFTILRGYSLFMISPLGSGKTIGYLPAICRLITDSQVDGVGSVGPIAIIVCATSKSVADVERISKMCLGLKERVLACYAGMDEFHITTSLLNGCDLLICTPSILVRLLQVTDFGVDLRRLATFVLDDCERLAMVYGKEIKFFLLKIKEMMKNRVNKELKVQYILASRIWCDFMESLAKTAPDTVVCIGAFQECVLYSKSPTTVKFLAKESKPQAVFDFLKDVDTSKRIVIVCRSDDEVVTLEKALTKDQNIVFACNSTMTLHDLYNLNVAWADYQDPVSGPILICCDNNLMHLNVTDAHYLLHYSLPQLFSMFCKRFSVLNDNFPSIFNTDNENVKIHILVDDTNVEQLPKILNFIKRCTNKIPESLNAICDKVLVDKDLSKAKSFVPICDNLLALGNCPDFWNCQERHTVLKEYDEPKEWMPKNGVITFKILHYHTAALYSARLISHINVGQVTKYPQTYSTLSLKMGMYFSKESNKRPHGEPKVGDVCAVSHKQNFFVRCQILKILSHYPKGTPNYVLIKLIDEEKYERSRDIYLFYLPNELRQIETHVVQVRLANIQPKDRDITFSDLALDQLKKITDNDEELYMRGKVTLTIGNCVFVDTLEACQSLTSLNEIVVKHDFINELLNAHAIESPEHVNKLMNMSPENIINEDSSSSIESLDISVPRVSVEPQWAHLDHDDISSVFFASAESPAKFFVRLAKFEDCMNILLKNIDKYVTENPNRITRATAGDLVLARFPDDGTFERARIDKVFEEKAKCFFVDQGDWRNVSFTDLVPIPDKLVTQMPFQAIECKLVGVKPPGDDWTEFCTNWFCDHCYDDNHEYLKNLNVKYFTKEKAESSGGYKYGVVLVDTTGKDDIIINQLLIDVNLAVENEDDINYLDRVEVKRNVKETEESADEDGWEKVGDNSKINCTSTISSSSLVDTSPANLIFRQPTRSVPLVGDDESSEDSDRWDINMANEFTNALKPLSSQNIVQKDSASEPRSENIDSPVIKAKDSKSNVKAPLANKINNSLDSDDLTTPENSVIAELNTVNNPKPILDETRKPKLVWKQTKTSVSVKILLICEDYKLEIQQHKLIFSSVANDTDYGFEIQLYGVINVPKCRHSNKGQYILVNLSKVIPRNWLTLTKDGVLRKWIVYDVDSIDASSDEEEVIKDHLENIVKNTHDNNESDSDEDDFIDDVNFTYKK